MTAPFDGYLSPFPAENRRNYYKRIEVEAVIERVHVFPAPDGGERPCNPRYRRECERERTWSEGQTRGT